jgi:hypothetical protein
MEYLSFTGSEYTNGVWHDVELITGHSYSYGDFEVYKGEVTDEAKKHLFIRPELLSGSDYSNSGSIQKSNHRVFLKDYKDVEGVYNTHGGYGTFAIVIRADVAEENEDIKSVLDSLEDYCLIDDEDHSNLEMEWQQIAMVDIIRDLDSLLDRDLELDRYIPDFRDTVSSETIEKLAWEATENLNLNWSYENNSAYLNAESLKPYVIDMILIEYCPDLPLFVNRDWSCDKALNCYKKKCSE